MINLLTNRSFQVFIFCIVALAAICTLIAVGSVTESQGFPLVTALIGFMVGVPVTTSPSSGQ